METVTFYRAEEVSDEKLRFAVMIARSDGRWVCCRHRERSTWEFPGGHREAGETILETAKRELYEETGALDFSIEPLCVYSVRQEAASKDRFDAQESFGMLFCAEIRSFESELHSEIGEISVTEALPTRWTYPEIQPRLLAYYHSVHPSGAEKEQK